MLLDEICDYLSTNGSTSDGVGLYASWMPPQGTAAVVYETGGMAPVRAFTGTTGQVVEECVGIQVVVRGSENASDSGYKVARLKADSIWGLLDNLGDVTLNGTRYFWIAAKQSPFLMGKDEMQRPLIACNYEVYKARSTS